ncbi:MAG TPA: hypothetical protein VFQ61_25585, partial [Polyangiaceae bacterium]|nr:hypothetical protein [Polyangiaceae bacterium]
ELLTSEARFIEHLVGTQGKVVIGAAHGERPRGTVVSVTGDVEVLVNLLGLVDAKKEHDRIERQLKKVTKDVTVMQKRLENPNFVNNAPPEVVSEAKAQLEQLQRQKVRLEEARVLATELE